MLTMAYPRPADFLAEVPFDCEIDRKLVSMDELLDDPKLVLAVTNDLARTAPAALWNGRRALPVEVTLRLAVARRLMGWSYRKAEAELAGSATWRWFSRLYSQPVPDHSSIHEREALIRPTTLRRLNTRVVRVAQARRVTRAAKLRSDGSVIETNTHYPTDSRLLDDSVRVLGRALALARELLHPEPADKALFRNRRRQAHRQAGQIGRRLRGQGARKPRENKAERLYRRLVAVAETTVAQAEAVLSRLNTHPSRRAQALAATL